MVNVFTGAVFCTNSEAFSLLLYEHPFLLEQRYQHLVENNIKHKPANTCKAHRTMSLLEREAMSLGIEEGLDL